MSRMQEVALEIKRLLKDSTLHHYVFHIDICNFRTFNHLHGYRTGDALLEQITHFLKGLPSCIYSKKGFADQFIFVIETALPLTDELLHRFHRYSHDFIQEKQLSKNMNLLFWCGVSEIIDGDVISAFENANIARIKAKREKLFVGCILTEKSRLELSAEDDLIMKCTNGLRNEAFFFHLQPQVDMKSGKIIAAEALARLKVDGKCISPADFIPVLERNGSVVDLDHMILRKVCEYLCNRRDRGMNLFPISINLSSIHLTIPNSSENLADIIREYNLPGELFCFEITEYNVIQDLEAAARYIQSQQDKGFKTSVDDFGSGYIGLNIIRKIPISEIKLDRSFLNDYDDACLAHRTRSVLSMIYQLTRDLGIRVICEGVETEEQRKMLTDIGYTIGQGFYLYRPCDPDEIIVSSFE